MEKKQKKNMAIGWRQQILIRDQEKKLFKPARKEEESRLGGH